MNQYVGLDVSQDQSWMCVVDESGRMLWQGKGPGGDRRHAQNPGAAGWTCLEKVESLS